jgi:hypothetical protein
MRIFTRYYISLENIFLGDFRPKCSACVHKGSTIMRSLNSMLRPTLLLIKRAVGKHHSTRMLSNTIPPFDVSPPTVSLLNSFDRSQFHKEIPVLAVRVTPAKAGLFLKSIVMKGYAMIKI